MTHPEEGNSKKETSKEWACDICSEPQTGIGHAILGYYESICEECFDRGLIWSIKEAWKWRSQIALDVLRRPKDGR